DHFDLDVVLLISRGRTLRLLLQAVLLSLLLVVVAVAAVVVGRIGLSLFPEPTPSRGRSSLFGRTAAQQFCATCIDFRGGRCRAGRGRRQVRYRQDPVCLSGKGDRKLCGALLGVVEL